MTTNSTPVDAEPADAPDTSVARSNKGNYFLAGIVVIFTVAVLAGRWYLASVEETTPGVTVVPEDVEDPIGSDISFDMPPIPKSEKRVDPNAEQIETLKAENKQIRMAMLEMRKAMLDAQRATPAAPETDDSDPYARYRGEHILTIDYTAAPAGAQPASLNGVAVNGVNDVNGHVPDGTSEAVKLAGLKYWIRPGTQIPILPVTPINTELGGMVVGLVDEDIHSSLNGKCLLIPKRSRAIGNVHTSIVQGGYLIRLTWTEIQDPDGTTIYTESQGGNSVGQPGVNPKFVDRKILARYGMPLLFSLLSVETDRISDSRGRDIAASMSEAASEILDDTLNIKPTAYLPHTDQLITLIVTNDWHFKGVSKCQ